ASHPCPGHRGSNTVLAPLWKSHGISGDSGNEVPEWHQGLCLGTRDHLCPPWWLSHSSGWVS
ncbi:unnamed protein product, partial [Rangifer tarandus platyrhynchus]